MKNGTKYALSKIKAGRPANTESELDKELKLKGPQILEIPQDDGG
jgi:hypothetical protein